MRAWIYHFMAILGGLALLGLALAALRRVPERRRLSVLAAAYFFFCVGLAYQVLITFLANGISSSAGWYLCAVMVPETVLLAGGLRTACTLAPDGKRFAVLLYPDATTERRNRLHLTFLFNFSDELRRRVAEK